MQSAENLSERLLNRGVTGTVSTYHVIFALLSTVFVNPILLTLVCLYAIDLPLHIAGGVGSHLPEVDSNSIVSPSGQLVPVKWERLCSRSR